MDDNSHPSISTLIVRALPFVFTFFVLFRPSTSPFPFLFDQCKYTLVSHNVIRCFTLSFCFDHIHPSILSFNYTNISSQRPLKNLVLHHYRPGCRLETVAELWEDCHGEGEGMDRRLCRLWRTTQPSSNFAICTDQFPKALP